MHGGTLVQQHGIMPYGKRTSNRTKKDQFVSVPVSLGIFLPAGGPSIRLHTIRACFFGRLSWIRPDLSSGQRFQTSMLIIFFPWYTISFAVKTSTTKSGLSTDLKYWSNIGFQYFFFVGISSWIFPFALIST